MADPARVESVDDEEEEMNLMETGDDDNSRSDQKLGEERDLSGDGGVLKKLLVAGEGWELPQKDDKVFVHYTGTLTDGTKFDSSVDRGEPFSFTLGASQVIKGWDTAVATMKQGEKVQLTLRSDYAYGDQGSPPTIPGGATLLFEVELLRWESVNDLSDEKDGSLMKKITQEGDLNVWDRPQDVDLVTVKLSAKVAGEADFFVKDVTEEFKLVDGFFCPAVKRIVKEMKQGEAVQVKAGPKYAFGDTGREGCPPGSKVELNIELLHVKAVKTIDPDHEGHVMKTILKDGSAHQTPNDNAEVCVSWTGKLANGTEFDKVVESTLKVQDDPFPNEALELAVMSMRHGEEAEVSVRDSRYAFGAAGLEGKVPANELVSYYVNLHSFTNGQDHWDMTPTQKIEMAEGLKGRGNQAMKAGNLGRARRLYEKVSNMLSMEHEFTEAEKSASREVQISTSLNTAAAALKQGKLRDCISECNKVLEKRSGHVKALYRRSQAYLEQGDYLEAEMDLKSALLSDPDSKDLAAAQKRLKTRMKEANKKDAKLFGAMFSKVGKMYEDVKVVPSSGVIDEPGLDDPEGGDDDLQVPKTADAEGDDIMKPLDAENVSGNV